MSRCLPRTFLSLVGVDDGSRALSATFARFFVERGRNSDPFLQKVSPSRARCVATLALAFRQRRRDAIHSAPKIHHVPSLHA
jgi:hypothetical protein